jgi:hypothetical protein
VIPLTGISPRFTGNPQDPCILTFFSSWVNMGESIDTDASRCTVNGEGMIRIIPRKQARQSRTLNILSIDPAGFRSITSRGLGQISPDRRSFAIRSDDWQLRWKRTGEYRLASRSECPGGMYRCISSEWFESERSEGMRKIAAWLESLELYVVET